MGVPPLGVFAEYQPLYATHNIPTFPVQGKRPAVKGYAKAGSNLSQQWALKFPEVDALAFMAGGRTRLSIVDVDSSDEALLRDTLARYGEAPIMVRTSSGGFHLWYRFNGEERKIRPDPDTPVDLLGGGVVVAPPSLGSKGPYEFIRGTLSDLHKLRPADNVIAFPKAKLERPAARELIGAGGRAKALLSHLRGEARHCDTLDDLLDVARSFADERLDLTGGHSFTEAEITSTAKSVWGWTQEKIAAGQYFVGTGKRLTLTFDAIDKVLSLGADATALYLTLQRRSNHRGELIVANDMRLTMPDGEWTLVRFRKARAALTGAGIITENKKPSTWHGPARYAWEQG